MRVSVPTIGRLPRQSRFGGSEFFRFFAFIELMWRVNRERSQLKKLDKRALNDLGLSQDMVDREAQRAFYDMPTSRQDRIWG